MVNEHLPTAQSLARWYAGRYRRPYDDMLSAAYFGLAQAIEWIRAGRGAGHEGPYITVTMHRFLREAVAPQAPTVPVDCLLETGHIGHPDGNLIVSEALASLTARERLVVNMRLRGETQAQIAATLSVSQPTISTILDTIRKKLCSAN